MPAFGGEINEIGTFSLDHPEVPDDFGDALEVDELLDDFGDALEFDELSDDSWDILEDENSGENEYLSNSKTEVKVEESTNSSKLEKSAENDMEHDTSDSPEKGKPIQNKIDGLQREADVKEELDKKYPEKKGYEIISEAYLRDLDGNIVKDPETGQARRIDFVVAKDGKVVDSIEVTSKTADKTDQLAKENRIRENGGNYVRDDNGNLIEIPRHVQTRVERRN